MCMWYHPLWYHIHFSEYKGVYVMKKRADGRYCKQIFVGYHPDGRRKMKTIYGKTIKEVEKKERDIRNDLELGVFVENDKMTVGQWADEWLEIYKKGLKSNTYNVYKYCVSAHFETIRQFKLRDLKLSHLQIIANELVEISNFRAAEIFKSTVSQMLEKAVENELISKNIASKIKLPKKQKTQKRALSKVEVSEILSLNISLKTRCFIEIMLFCGLRRGEAWALTKNDIDFGNKTITVNKTIYFDTTDGRKILIGTPKSKSSNRTVPIPDILINDLTKYIQSINGQYLFDGELMKEYQFRKMWNDFICIYKTNVSVVKDDITPHIFRHTYATMLYNAGVDIKTAQYLLGHATIQMTLDIYTHLQDGKETEAAEKLNALMSVKC